MKQSFAKEPIKGATCKPGREPFGPSEPCWPPELVAAAFMRFLALENFFSWISTWPCIHQSGALPATLLLMHQAQYLTKALKLSTGMTGWLW